MEGARRVLQCNGEGGGRREGGGERRGGGMLRVEVEEVMYKRRQVKKKKKKVCRQVRKGEGEKAIGLRGDARGDRGI